MKGKHIFSHELQTHDNRSTFLFIDKNKLTTNGGFN